MEKWGQDPNNEQCIYTLLIIRILAPNLFLRYWGQDPNNEQCLYNIAHYQDTCPSFLKNDNFLVSNFNQQVAEKSVTDRMYHLKTTWQKMAIFTLNGFCHFLLLQNFVKKTGLKMAIFYIKCLLPFFAPEFCLQKWDRKWQIFILNGLSHFLPQNFVDKNRVENGRFLS